MRSAAEMSFPIPRGFSRGYASNLFFAMTPKKCARQFTAKWRKRKAKTALTLALARNGLAHSPVNARTDPHLDGKCRDVRPGSDHRATARQKGGCGSVLSLPALESFCPRREDSSLSLQRAHPARFNPRRAGDRG